MQDLIDFNPYKLISKIGKGAFGSVYLVEKDNQKYAIKRIDMRLMKQREFLRKYFESEINAMKTIQHKNVLQLIELLPSKSNNNNIIDIVLPYCEKGNLYSYIMQLKDRKLNEQEAKKFMIQLLDGVRVIHENNYIHRDLKPENILITKDNILKVADFGLSKQLSKGQYTSTNAGSALYKAPEIYSQKKYNHQVDMWSLGCIFFFLLTGEDAFHGINESIVYKNMIQKCRALDSQSFDLTHPDLERYKHIFENISQEMKNLLSEILTIDPKKRISKNLYLFNIQLTAFQQIYNHPILIAQADQESLEKFTKSKIFYQQLTDKNFEDQDDDVQQFNPPIIEEDAKEEDEFYVASPDDIRNSLIKAKNIFNDMNNFCTNKKNYYIDCAQLEQKVGEGPKKLKDHLLIELYKCETLSSVKRQISHFSLAQQDLYLLQYSLSKVEWFYCEELAKMLKNPENICKLWQIQRNDVDQYLKMSGEKLSKYLSDRISMISMDIFLNKLPNALKVLNYIPQKDADIRKMISDSLTETNFDAQLKIPYRKTILNAYHKLTQARYGKNNSQIMFFFVDDKVLPLVLNCQLRLLFCHLIQRIFDPMFVLMHFQTLLNQKQAKEFNLTLLEEFLLEASDQTIVKQGTEIISTYFSQKQ